MILGNIKDAKKYFCTNERFEKAFEILKSLDDSATERITVEDGIFWVNIAEFDEVSDGEKQFEAHRYFLDIHFIISGEEKFGYADIEKLCETQAYDAENDYLLLSGDADAVTLRKGDFCVVFPEDAHIPVMAKGEGKLKKAIVKIKI